MNEQKLPYQRLDAFQVAKELLQAVVAAQISDAELRDQATRAAKSAALNTAEAAGRSSQKDQARVFAIARGEANEAAAAIELALVLGAVSTQSHARVQALAVRVCSMLTRLARI